jgi:hypothetical protein
MAAARRKYGTEAPDRTVPSAAAAAELAFARTTLGRAEFKTGYCRDFANRGFCRWGNDCRHSHATGPVPAATLLGATALPTERSKAKTKAP